MLAAACVVTLLGVAVAIAFVVTSRRPAPTPARQIVVRPLLSTAPARPFLMFISLAPGETFKRVVLAPLAAPDEARYVTPLNCERVYYAGSRGLCLTATSTRPGVATYFAHVFDEHFSRLRTLTLSGCCATSCNAPIAIRSWTAIRFDAPVVRWNVRIAIIRTRPRLVRTFTPPPPRNFATPSPTHHRCWALTVWRSITAG